MMSQVAGRAGRRGRRGLVVVQTKQADNPIIDYVRRSDYEAMYRQQLAERQAFGYPPFSRIISIYLKHRNDAVVDHAARHLAALLRPHFADGMLGPDRPVVARVQMQYIRKSCSRCRCNSPPQACGAPCWQPAMWCTASMCTRA